MSHFFYRFEKLAKYNERKLIKFKETHTTLFIQRYFVLKKILDLNS